MNPEILKAIWGQHQNRVPYTKIIAWLKTKGITISKTRLKYLCESGRKYQELDTAIRAVVPVTEYNIDAEYQPLKGEECITAVIGDTHIGKLSKGYNTEIAISRIVWLITQLAGTASSLGLTSVNIVFTGDMVDGLGIYPKQAHYIDNTLLEQLFAGIPAISKAMGELAKSFNVNVYATYGNHGRLSYYYDEMSNLDLMFYKALQVACTNMPINFNISKQSIHAFKILKHRVVAAHGNDVTGNPAITVGKRAIHWLATCEYKDVELFIFGHFHTAFSYQCQRSHIIVNGTTVTGDRYAMEKMGLDSSPCQIMFVSTPKHVVAQIYYLYPEDYK